MDGIQDACEPPVAGLFVTLIDQATGMVIDVDTTDSNGNYYFTDEEGVELDSSYTIVFGYNSAAATQQYDPASGEVLIDGTVYSFTTPQSVEGNNPDQNDSDAVVMAISGIGDFPSTSISNVQQTNHDLDAGLVGDASLSLGSTVFTDLNNNGLQDAGDTGIPGVLVIVYAEGGDGTADGADDTPVVTGADGIVGTADDAFGPDGISGNADDGQPGMLTDANGDYFFAGLAMGDYYVEIPAGAFGAGEALENLPLSSNTSSSTFAGETDPDDNADSDDDGTQAGGSATAITSGIISLAAGEEPVDGTGATDEAGQGNAQDNAPDYVDADGNMTLDFGLFAPVTVGDFTFVDVDGDGLQGGPDDVPLENVTVTIIDVNTGQPVAVDADGNPYVATQMTTNTGAYLFTNLPPGNYQVTFDLGSVTDGELYDFTTPNAGNDTDDSDASPAAPMDDVASSGPTGELTSGQSDLTLDAGVVCAVIVELAEPFAICSSQQVDLTQNITVSPASLAATAVFTSSGDGDFLDAGGAVLTSGTTFGTAVTYRPGTADAARGMVTITLTTEDPAGPCDPASDSVTVEILGVDCGSFFWDGR